MNETHTLVARCVIHTPKQAATHTQSDDREYKMESGVATCAVISPK